LATQGYEYHSSLRSGRTRMRKISAVTFDLWDTLIQELPGEPDKVARARNEGILRLLERRGIVHSRAEIEAAYLDTGQFLSLTWSKRRDMSTRDQVLFMLNSLDDKLAQKLAAEDLAEIERVYSSGILEHPPRLLPGAKDALRTVKVKGYRMGLISNTGRTPGSVLRILMSQMGVLDFFDTTTFSNEILVRKPAESAFRITLEKLRAAPKTAVHIGDSEESDIAGAKRVGMYAIQVRADGEKGSRLADVHVRSIDSVADHIGKL
jgi:putative hydrolase of the HAD superfamily